MLNMAIVVICELVVAQLINQWRECLTPGPMKTTTEVVIKKIIHSERWSHQFKYRTSVNDFLIFFLLQSYDITSFVRSHSHFKNE